MVCGRSCWLCTCSSIWWVSSIWNCSPEDFLLLSFFKHALVISEFVSVALASRPISEFVSALASWLHLLHILVISEFVSVALASWLHLLHILVISEFVSVALASWLHFLYILVISEFISVALASRLHHLQVCAILLSFPSSLLFLVSSTFSLSPSPSFFSPFSFPTSPTLPLSPPSLPSFLSPSFSLSLFMPLQSISSSDGRVWWEELPSGAQFCWPGECCQLLSAWCLWVQWAEVLSHC